ncbi:MAG: hypothetical protein Q9169_008097 [Polycauliona sp. 2 TL-2023]
MTKPNSSVNTSFIRQVTYLENLAKVYKHYTTKSGTLLAPPELLPHILAQIEELIEYGRPTVLDPNLKSIRSFMRICKDLGCAHETEAATDLKDLKFREIEVDLSEESSETDEEAYSRVRRGRFSKGKRY